MTKYQLAGEISKKARVGKVFIYDNFGLELEDLVNAETKDDFYDIVLEIDDNLDRQIRQLIAVKRAFASLDYKEVCGHE